MDDNPYRSPRPEPAAPSGGEGQQGSGLGRMATSGLFAGGLAGAGAGTAAGICLWFVLLLVLILPELEKLATVAALEVIISGAVVAGTIGALGGGAAGALVGSALAIVAGVSRPTFRRKLTLLAVAAYTICGGMIGLAAGSTVHRIPVAPLQSALWLVVSAVIGGIAAGMAGAWLGQALGNVRWGRRRH